MIKRLRKRFVRLSMILISVVLIVFYMFTMLVVFLRETENVQETLKNYSSESYYSQYFDLGVSDEKVNKFAIDSGSICVVNVDAEGNLSVLDIARGHIQENLLQQIVEHIVDGRVEFGILLNYNLFYYKTVINDGCRIAFADSSRYLLYLRDMFYADGIVFLIALFVLLFIVRQLAKIFIKPVQKAWEQQQNFIADASHELKTPLTVILTNCDILQSHPEASLQDEMKWIESTNEEAVHMKEMVNKMLLLAKSENTKPGKINTYVNISELATKVVLQFDPVAYEAGVTLNSEIEDDVEIKADNTAVNQIIHILVDNAVKYAGIDGLVTLRLHRFKNAVYLSATNTGEPIPEEDLPHLFERFYRSDKARTAGSGYGLGLSICKSLAEQQKAVITVKSDRENGTEFTVIFKKQKPRKKSNEN